MRSEYSITARRRGVPNPDAELDALVAAELAELGPELRLGGPAAKLDASSAASHHENTPLPEEPSGAKAGVEAAPAADAIALALADLALRLRAHPDRLALFEGLRASVFSPEMGAVETAATTASAAPQE